MGWPNTSINFCISQFLLNNLFDSCCHLSWKHSQFSLHNQAFYLLCTFVIHIHMCVRVCVREHARACSVIDMCLFLPSVINIYLSNSKDRIWHQNYYFYECFIWVCKNRKNVLFLVFLEIWEGNPANCWLHSSVALSFSFCLNLLQEYHAPIKWTLSLHTKIVHHHPCQAVNE